jgi:methylphosphotriester-DNA--protein-cysteine methyltransferase
MSTKELVLTYLANVATASGVANDKQEGHLVADLLLEEAKKDPDRMMDLTAKAIDSAKAFRVFRSKQEMKLKELATASGMHSLEILKDRLKNP